MSVYKSGDVVAVTLEPVTIKNATRQQLIDALAQRKAERAKMPQTRRAEVLALDTKIEQIEAELTARGEAGT